MLVYLVDASRGFSAVWPWFCWMYRGQIPLLLISGPETGPWRMCVNVHHILSHLLTPSDLLLHVPVGLLSGESTTVRRAPKPCKLPSGSTICKTCFLCFCSRSAFFRGVGKYVDVISLSWKSQAPTVSSPIPAGADPPKGGTCKFILVVCADSPLTPWG